jgi:hypothetical protein
VMLSRKHHAERPALTLFSRLYHLIFWRRKPND